MYRLTSLRHSHKREQITITVVIILKEPKQNMFMQKTLKAKNKKMTEYTKAYSITDKQSNFTPTKEAGTHFFWKN